MTREEVRVEREPITEANRGEALSGADITEEEHEVVLHAERAVVVQTEAVPVERVRLGTETVTEQETVTGEVRKEQIEVDDDVHHPRGRTTAAATSERWWIRKAVQPNGRPGNPSRAAGRPALPADPKSWKTRSPTRPWPTGSRSTRNAVT